MPEELGPRRRTDEVSLFLDPQQLAEYASVDPALPALAMATRDSELKRRFYYAVLSLVAGVLVVFGILGTFVYLVMNDHPQAAAAVLGAGVLGLVGGFVRSRL